MDLLQALYLKSTNLAGCFILFPPKIRSFLSKNGGLQASTLIVNCPNLLTFLTNLP